MESAFAIKHETRRNKVLKLSEQQVIDCSIPYNNGGCDYGWHVYAWDYMQDHAMVSLQDYPMVSHVKGRHDEDCKDTLNLKGHVSTDSGNKAYVHVPSDLASALSAVA